MNIKKGIVSCAVMILACVLGPWCMLMRLLGLVGQLTVHNFEVGFKYNPFNREY